MSDLDIGNLNSNQNYLGLVDSNDPFNLYKFSLNSPGKVGVSLTGLSGNADLQILDNSEKVLYSSASSDTSNEVIAIDNLAAGNYTIRINQVSGKTNYNLSLTIEEIEKIQVDVITGLNIESGYFIVGETGQVGVDFINDGGKYKGELAIFSLAGIDNFTPGSAEFIKEAANRALSNSNLGYIVISDSKEGAKFNVGLANADNDGEYKGIKTFAMKPGDTFGVMLVPNGKVEEVFNKPDINGNKRPLFSLVTANPNEAFHLGQVADINGMGSAFAIEDQRVDKGTDKDYNDVIFQLTGATGKAVNLDKVINLENDWRDSTLGKDLIDYVHKKELAIDPNPPIDTTPVDPNPPIDTTPIDPNPPIDNTPIDPNPPVDPKLPVDTTPQIDRNQPLIGVIDTGFSGNNPDLDYRRFLLGSDRISQDNNPLLSPGEGSEHGTHILGLIAATQGNEIGIDGINDKAPIWLGRAVGSGNWADSLIEFVDAAKQSGQKNAIVNLSLDLTQINQDGSVTTRYELTPKEREAIEYARQNHVLIVTAAGNDGGVMSVLGQASQEFDNIITVGASDGSDRANYSSYGAGLDIVTEGGTIYKPVLSTVKDDVGMIVGTSAAAAKATGVASLVWAANPDLNFKQVIQILESTATDLKTSGWDGETGFGLLNSAAAVELAKNTAGENYTPEPWVTPFTWDGEGKVTPTERAAEGGISIATAPQFSPTFSDNDKVDSTTPEKYYQFTVNQPGYVRWTLTRTNGSDEFPGAAVVKADSTPGRFKFVPGGAMLSGSVDGQTTPISRTDGVFVDPGTYYLKLQNGITNTVKNYNLSNQFIPDSISTFQTPVNYSTTPYFDFSPDIQTKAFNGSSATGLNVSGQVEFKFGDLSKRTAKYGLEVKETGKLNFNVLSPNGMVEVKVEKFIGSEDTTTNLFNTSFTGNSNYPAEITLNKGRYQIEIKANGDEVSDINQILQLPYTLTGVFSRIAPLPGEANVPIGAGNFIKTVTSNGVDTHYYTNGYLSVQPKGTSTWYTSGTGDTIPLLGGTITPIEDTVKKYSFEYYYGNGTFLNGQYAGGGDYYKGYFYANDGFYFKDQRIAQTTFNSSGNKGFYKITDASLSGSSSDVGDVYITSYSDNDTSKGVFKTLNFDEALTNQGLGKEYGYIGSKFFDKDTELDLSDPDGNTSMSTSEYLQLNQATSGKSIGGGFDRQDYYRFSLDRINDVSIQLSGLTASSGFSVIQDLNNNGQFEPNESLGVSSGTATTQWIRTTFAAGNYYVRVFPDNPNDLNGKTNYNLKVSATPELPGNTFGQAYNVGLLNNYYGNPKGFTGILRTNHDTEDYYQFQLDRRSNVSLTLDGLITTRLGSAMVEGVTPNTLLQLIRDTNSNGQIDAGEVRGSVFANPTQTGSINKSLEAGNYFVRVTPEGSNPVNTAYAITMSAQSRPIPTTRWNARFINRNPDNVADFNNYDFSNPTAVLDLGSQKDGDGKIRLYKDFGLNSPAFNVQSDNFAMEASTITRLEAGKLYKVTTKSDDGTQFFLTKVGSATTRKNLEQLGGWSNGDWRDRGADEPAKTIYFKVPESGDYVFDVQYYEKGIGSKIDVTLEPHQPFPANTNTEAEWHSEFFWWDRTKGDKPPVDFSTDRSNVIGSLDQGSNDLGGGKKGINFDWDSGLPKNKDNNIDDRLPGDYFAISSHTKAHFDAGKKYRFTVKGDDGFKLLAKNHDLPDNDPNKWVYITPKDQWQQSYGETVYEFTLPENAPTGWYDLHFHFYEQGGDANFNLSWEEVKQQNNGGGNGGGQVRPETLALIEKYDRIYSNNPPQPYHTGDVFTGTNYLSLNSSPEFFEMWGKLFQTTTQPHSDGSYLDHYYIPDNPVQNNTYHAGIDFSVPSGTPVKALVGGEVVYVGTWDGKKTSSSNPMYSGEWGTIAIYNATLKQTFMYLHMGTSQFSEGDVIQAGTVIGISGSTGAASPHLHLEVKPTPSKPDGSTVKGLLPQDRKNWQTVEDLTDNPLTAYLVARDLGLTEGGDAFVNPPQNPGSSIEYKIDWNFISQLEGGAQSEGYVPWWPGAKNNVSGVTIATGFDLGQKNEDGLRNMGLASELVDKLSPYLGKRMQEAVDFLAQHPLSLSSEEVSEIDKKSKSQAVGNLEKRYNSVSAVPFKELPSQAQTTIASVAFQYGTNFGGEFWDYVTKQKWGEAVQDLRTNFNDGYANRRNQEADLLNQIV